MGFRASFAGGRVQSLVVATSHMARLKKKKTEKRRKRERGRERNVLTASGSFSLLCGESSIPIKQLYYILEKTMNCSLQYAKRPSKRLSRRINKSRVPDLPESDYTKSGCPVS